MNENYGAQATAIATEQNVMNNENEQQKAKAMSVNENKTIDERIQKLKNALLNIGKDKDPITKILDNLHEVIGELIDRKISIPKIHKVIIATDLGLADPKTGLTENKLRAYITKIKDDRNLRKGKPKRQIT